MSDGSAARMSLGELTAAADVSVRTVRYYIAEGLLPPPEGAGPGSSYSRGHLDRLRLIQRLKEAFFPLKEIRRQLAGLDDAEVRAILAGEVAAGDGDPWSIPEGDTSLAGARRYLALLESRERYRTEPMALQFAAQRAEAEPAALLQEDNVELPDQARARLSHRLAPREPHLADRRDRRARTEDDGLWRRIPLGDGAELVISDRVYARHRDRIDWLVRWARKVFD